MLCRLEGLCFEETVLAFGIAFDTGFSENRALITAFSLPIHSCLISFVPPCVLAILEWPFDRR